MPSKKRGRDSLRQRVISITERQTMKPTSTSAIPTPSFVSGTKRLLIGGGWVEAKSGKAFDSVNPATGEVIAQVAQGDKINVNKAVVAARKAFAWLRTGLIRKRQCDF